MAPLPKRRHSTRRGGKRKASIRLRFGELVVCKNCNAKIIPHQVCGFCGYYAGRPVIVKKEKKTIKNSQSEQ